MKNVWPLIGLMCALLLAPPILAVERSNETVIQEFAKQEEQARQGLLEKQQAETRKRHQILFLMGIALLVSVFTTAGLGIAMALYGKEVFIAHMVFAGISVTLAIVHAVVAIVWFYPV